MLSENQKKQKKEELTEKCLKLFIERGLERTSIKDLAEYCGTYKAAFYNYFSSKDEIVIECANMYMKKLENLFSDELSTKRDSVLIALKKASSIIENEKNGLRFVYQVVSSPNYGDESRKSLSEIYDTYLGYSYDISKLYNIDHERFRPYYLLFIATIHDFCLWENKKTVDEKLKYIYNGICNL